MRRTPFIRTCIWLSLLGGLALVWLAVAAPLLSWRADTSVQLQQSQTEARRLLGSIANLERQKATLSADVEFSDVWSANSTSQATAQVQATLGTIAREHGVTFRSITPLPNPDMALTDAVAFRVEAELTLDRLVELLRALEYGSPLLLIERTNIRRLARSSPNATQPTVFVQLDLTAPVMMSEEDT